MAMVPDKGAVKMNVVFLENVKAKVLSDDTVVLALDDMMVVIYTPAKLEWSVIQMELTKVIFDSSRNMKVDPNFVPQTLKMETVKCQNT